MNFLLVAAGIVILFVGGELLVRYSSRLGRYFGLSPLVVGLTIVAFGTSAPELAASLIAVLRGSADLALGNVVGSNIANLGLVLGVAALLHPIRVVAKFVHREGLWMLLSSSSMLWFGGDGLFSRGEGLVLFAFLLLYLFSVLRTRAAPEVEDEFSREYSEKAKSVFRASLLVLVSVALLVVGAEVLVRGAVGAARQLGVPERVIGLTMVALGTSLPELATSVVAALKRQGDIVVGNLVGSNIFNVLAVLGITASVGSFVVDWASARTDVWLMLGVSALTLVLLRWRLKIGRLAGAVLLACYIGYMAYLFLRL